MRISLIANEANVENRVGSNQYAFELIKALYQLDKNNEYLIHLFQPPLPDLPQPRKNWRYQVAGPQWLWNVFGLPRALCHQRPRPDVVFNPGHYTPLFCLVPLVISIMDLGFLRFPRQFTLPILAKLKFWTRFSVRRAAHILAISRSTKDNIVKNYQISKSKITVTYPGYDKKEFRIKNKEARSKKNYILFLGTLKPNKNIEGLLEAFKLLLSRTPPRSPSGHLGGDRRSPARCNLVIAGRKGWMFESIFKKVKQLGLEDRVIFPGFVPEKEVSALMRGARAFVLPSFWEGFGIPVVEAMACGTPVVVSGRGSLPEIVGKAGVIVDPDKPKSIADGIGKALKNYDKLSKRGLKQVQKFSWQKCAQETLAVLNNVVKSD